MSDSLSSQLIDNFKRIDKRPFPVSGFFIGDSSVMMNFAATNHQLARRETSVAFANLPFQSQPIFPVHNDSEKLVTFSDDGRVKALIRSTPFNKTMPVDTPKIGEQGNVVFVEVYRDGELISNKLLDEKSGDFQTHPTVTSGIVLSPEAGFVAWVAATKKLNERKSKLGFKVKTFDFKDYGEDIDGVYGTNLVVYDIKNDKVHILGAPEKYGACRFCFASENVIVLQAINLSSPRIEGIRSYENRHFHLFAVNIANLNDDDKVEFKLLKNDKKYLYPASFRIDENTAEIFCGRFADDFGGHNGPCHFATFKLNLNDLSVNDYRESQECYSFVDLPHHPFIDKDKVALTIERRCKLIPIQVDLNTFKDSILIDEKDSSIVIDDYRNGKYLLRKASLVETPRFAVFSDNHFEFLNSSTSFDELSIDFIFNDNYNDAILLIAPGEKKKFIVVPHGGPHGMYSTYFSRNFAFMALCGYSLVIHNYRGSTGYPIDVQRSLPGNCGFNDVEDCANIIKQVREKFNIEKFGIYGHSQGGTMTTQMAGQHPDLIDFAIAGAPVTNFVSSYYTCDIPDWALYEAGVRRDCEGEYEMDENAFHKMWNASSIRHAKNAKVPVLLVHGVTDRRVHMIQSIDFYLAMKRNGNPVKMILYEMNGHSLKLSSCNDDVMANIIEFANDPKAYIERDDSDLYNDPPK